MVDIQNCFYRTKYLNYKAAFYQVQRDAQGCGTKWTDKVKNNVYLGTGFKNAISETPKKSAITEQQVGVPPSWRTFPEIVCPKQRCSLAFLPKMSADGNGPNPPFDYRFL